MEQQLAIGEVRWWRYFKQLLAPTYTLCGEPLKNYTVIDEGELCVVVDIRYPATRLLTSSGQVGWILTRLVTESTTVISREGHEQ